MVDGSSSGSVAPVVPGGGEVWSVSRGVEADGPWQVRVGARVVESVRSHYDVREVLEVAEQLAGRALLWRLDGGDGFVSSS